MTNKLATTTIDLLSDQLAADPWPYLKALREQGPIVWHEEHRRWLITTYREARQVATDFEHFTVEGTIVEGLFGADAFIAMDDRQRHNQLREIWADAFRAQALDTMREPIRAIIEQLLTPVLAQLRDGQAVDLSTALCRPLPTMVIALMMGVPNDRLADVVTWSNTLAGGSTSFIDESKKQAVIEAREQAKSALADYLLELMAQRRKSPGPDLVSLIVRSELGKTLSDHQITPNLRQLLFAGNETTAKWLDQIFLTYAQRSDIQQQLASDRSLVRGANEEVLRWQGVVGTLPRRVRGGGIEIAGVTLADGDDVTCILASANRDPAQFNDPDVFDIHRKSSPNLGFGVGLHNCLGASLARLETEMAVNALLDEIAGFKLAGPYTYSSLPLRGPTPVTVALTDL